MVYVPRPQTPRMPGDRQTEMINLSVMKKKVLVWLIATGVGFYTTFVLQALGNWFAVPALHWSLYRIGRCMALICSLDFSLMLWIGMRVDGRLKHKCGVETNTCRNEPN